MHILKLSGTPRQRGQRHGEQLRTEIAAVLQGWCQDIEWSTRQPAGRYIEQFLARTKFLPAIERWTPDLLDEVKGIAEGANQSFETMLALQCMDEDWWFREALEPREHCSGFGIGGQGAAPLLAQNMDIHTLTDGYQVLLHLQQDDFTAYVFSFAGFLGLTGLNSCPVGICCNTLSQLNYAPEGLPVAFIVRGVLEQPDLEAAESFLRRIRHASGQNYLVGGSAEVRDFECSANGVAQAGRGEKRLWHTNHPLVSEDYRPGEKDVARKRIGGNSHQRLEFLKNCLGVGVVDADAVKQALSVQPVCFQREKESPIYTSGSLVMTLSAPPQLEITFGPPAPDDYATILL